MKPMSDIDAYLAACDPSLYTPAIEAEHKAALAARSSSSLKPKPLPNGLTRSHRKPNGPIVKAPRPPSIDGYSRSVSTSVRWGTAAGSIS